MFTTGPRAGHPVAVIEARVRPSRCRRSRASSTTPSTPSFCHPRTRPTPRAFASSLPWPSSPLLATPMSALLSRSPTPARCSGVRARHHGLRRDRRSGPRRCSRRRHRNRRPHRRSATTRDRLRGARWPLAACTGLPASAFAAAVHAPRIASVGIRQVFAELPLLARPHRRAARLRRLLGRQGLPAPRRRNLAPAPLDPDRSGSVRVRMFGPTLGVLEDPATGSAAGARGGLLASRGEGEHLVIDGYRDGPTEPHRVFARGMAGTIAGPASRCSKAP